MTPTANGTPGRQMTTPPRAYSKEEIRNMAVLTGLLEKKDVLLAELTAMNNQAEKMVRFSVELGNGELIIVVARFKPRLPKLVPTAIRSSNCKIGRS